MQQEDENYIDGTWQPVCPETLAVDVPGFRLEMPCMAIPTSHTPSRSQIEGQGRKKKTRLLPLLCLAFKCRYCGRYRALSHMLRRIWTMSPGIHVRLGTQDEITLYQPSRDASCIYVSVCTYLGNYYSCSCRLLRTSTSMVCTCMNTSV